MCIRDRYMGAPQTKTYYNQSSKVKFSWDRLPNKCPGSEKSPKVAGGMGKYKNARLQPINQPLVNGDGKQWENPAVTRRQKYLSLIHICRCRRYAVCRSRWSPYH
eukprot:TRINITY_DN6603_c0_g1_i5.p2 TRINITY_DN6603_c0_g1~~TRINITY_DN6603_c0_g1_i5.p2  ORF type:complete len:105 (+),score=29.71 TRINITY_DN6603_c0_g1_i5:79-393(+)